MNRDESIRFATKYLEDLLSFFGINVAVWSTIDDDVIQLSVPSTSLNSLLIRVNVDVADYKRQRAERIEQKAEGWIQKVRETGEPMTLELNAVDRRVVHKLAEDYSDITTHSEGEGRARHLIIAKKPL